MGYGGAEQLLVHMVRHGDRERFQYEVAYMLEDFDALVPQLTDAGVPVHSLGAASNRDLGWTRPVAGPVAPGRFRCHALAPAPRGNTRAHGRRRRARRRRHRPALVYTEHSMWDKMALLSRR